MKRILIFIASTTMLFSCSKFGDTNVSPTQLTVASTNALLTNSLQSMSDLVLGNAASSRLGSLYVQHLSEGPYPGSSLYSDRNLSFSTWYTGPLYNLETIIKYNTDGNAAAAGNGSSNNQIGVAKILKAYYYLLMTDRWGDIPYSIALKANEDYSPAYDKQQDIYTSLFAELTAAVSQINETETAVKGDVLFNGNMAAWKRFANTMRMTMALRLSKADATKGKTEYAAAVAAGVITSNAQNIAYSFISGDPNNSNPWYNNYSISNRNDYAISKTLTDYMQPKNDPRLPIYGEVLAGNLVKGLPYGRNAAVNIPAAYSRIGSYFRNQGSALPLFNYAQVLFMQAEAAKLGYVAGGDVEAEAKYKAAIKASWEQYGVFNQAAYDAYLLQTDVAYTPAEAHKKIMTEKWVHMYLNSWEPWNDWRRTGFPVLVAAQDAVDSRGIPFRLGYPTNEASLNGENYAAAVTALGGTDDNYAKMWWAK
jgi:Starch-binding associating with outer membrane